MYKPSDLLFVPLGGSGEIGMNANLYHYDGSWLMVDLGISFPDDSLPGIDVLLPDLSFIESRRDKLAGLVLTHGHEDHLGAIPLYAKGQGVKQDWETAHALFIEASRLNHNLATFSLAIMYLKGQGVQPNLTTAYLWANLAANRNHETSRKLRDDIAKRLTPDQLIDANKIVHNCGPRTVDPQQFDSYVACISENR